MAMYTAVWLDMTLTPRGFEAISALYYARMVADILRKQNLEKHRNVEAWALVAQDYPELAKWAMIGHCGFIPFAPNHDYEMYEDCSYERPHPQVVDDALQGWALHPGELDAASRRWIFTAALTNYRCTIQFFLSYVVPLIAERVNRGWVRYEESDNPTHWEEYVRKWVPKGG